MGAFFIRWRQQDSICIFSRWEKIVVETSVCTGFSKCPPDTCSAMGSSPESRQKRKTTPKGVVFFLVETTGLEPVTSCV